MVGLEFVAKGVQIAGSKCGECDARDDSKYVVEYQLNLPIKEFGFGLKGDSEYVAGYQLGHDW